MDEAEAEGALLALGARLTWLAYDEETDANFAFTSDTEPEWYTVSYSREIRTFCAEFSHYDNATRDRSIFHYPTMDRAKAACERHHATGKWE